MTDYAKATNIELDKSEDLIRKLKPLLNAEPKENTHKKIREVIAEWEEEWSGGSPIEPLSDVWRTLDYHIKTYEVGEPFKWLNDKDYWLIRDGLITIGGEANTGKSSFVSALSLEILLNNRDTAFLFYTLDDSIPLTAKRILSQLTKKNLFISTEEPVLEKQEVLKRVFLKDRIVLEKLEQEARKVKAICGCEKIVVAIDYLQILPTPTEEQKREALNNALKQLKETQKRLSPGCILFLVSQLNRDTGSLTYRYRETSEVENQSDVCIDLAGNGRTEIRVAKNKLGKKGRSFFMRIQDDFTFSLLSEEEQETPPFITLPKKRGKR